MGKAIFKLNNGNCAILCSHCNTIVKNGFNFTEKEWSALRGEGDVESVYCDSCKEFVVELFDLQQEKKIDSDVLKNVIPHMKENDDFKLDLLNGFMKKIINKTNIDNGN